VRAARPLSDRPGAYDAGLQTAGAVRHPRRRARLGGWPRRRASLDLARGAGLSSIAFPAISTGIYGYPLEAATKIAERTVREEMAQPGSIARVIFACFSDRALAAYAAAGVSA